MSDSGILVQHKDGRKGIIRKRYQIPKTTNEGKIIVQFVDDDFRPDGAKRAVKRNKLQQIGYVD